MNRVMQEGLWAVLFIVLTAGCGVSMAEDAPSARRNVEEAGGFSFVPPEGWQTRLFPGLKYKIVFGTPANGFAPNINVVDEQFKGTLDAYVDASAATIQRVLKNAHVVKRDAFKTDDGTAGVRQVVEDEQQGKKLRQVFFFFGRDDTKFVATCSTLADGGEKLDGAFETSMKSFRFEKKK